VPTPLPAAEETASDLLPLPGVTVPVAGPAPGLSESLLRQRPTFARLLAATLAGAVAGMSAALFGRPFVRFAPTWFADPTYLYACLVLAVSVWLAWRTVRRQGWPTEGDLPGGLVWLAIGVALRLAATALPLPLFDFLALAAGLFGVAVAVGGRDWAAGLAFPVGFLFFLLPLPTALTTQLGFLLQEVVAPLAAWVLGRFTAAHQQGYRITLPDSPIDVGDPCAGVRQSIAFVALAVLAARMRRSWWSRGVLLLAAAPVAIAANVARAALTPLGERTPLAGETYAPLLGDLFTLAVGLGLLLGLSWCLGHLPEEADGGPEEAPSPEALSPSGAVALLPRLGLVAGCLVAGFIGQAQLRRYLDEGASPPPPDPPQPLAAFPEIVGRWTAARDTTVRSLAPAGVGPALVAYSRAADDRLDRIYLVGGSDARGPACGLWAVYYRNGRDRNYHPLLAYRAAGIAEDPAGRARIEVRGRSVPIERFCFGRGARKVYVYYWHYSWGAPASLPQGARRAPPLPSLTVEVTARADDPLELEAVSEFVRQVDHDLQGRLPDGARMGSDPAPVELLAAPGPGPVRP
jgi:exosortase